MDHLEHIRVRANDDAVVIYLCDRLLVDAGAIAELQIELLTVIFDLNPRRFIVSFANVERILTEVVNVMLFAREQIVQRNGVMSLCEMQTPIREVFALLHLDFDIYETISDCQRDSSVSG